MSTVRQASDYEMALRELLDRVSGAVSHDVERMEMLARLQSDTYGEVAKLLERYLKRRDEILLGYRSHAGNEAYTQ